MDGRPVIDLKPYVREFEKLSDVRNGWIDLVNKK